MAKATVQDIERIGFSSTQFGSPADWSTESGYLDALLDGVALEVREAVGAGTYDGAGVGSFTEYRITEAEKYLASAELWRRRAVFIERASITGQRDDTVGEQERCYRNAAAAEDAAWALLEVLGASRFAGLSQSVVETEHFA